MRRIDAHIHFPGDTPEAVAMLESEEVKVLNICYAEDSNGAWREQANIYGSLAKSHPHVFSWCTSFDLPRFDDSGYVRKAIDGLERDFEAGAVACKVWKNIGMSVRRPSGELIRVDDSLLEPIFSFVERSGRTLLMHIADPLSCWLPPNESSPHYGYYRNHPEWYMYGREDALSHEALMESRDAVVARHPNLRVIGAHLGSLEYDLDAVASRLERFPNFAVDMSARLGDLARYDREKVAGFCLRYQDRILFGTDHGTRCRLSEMSNEESRSALIEVSARFHDHFRFFMTEEPLAINGHSARGIGLAPEAADKILRKNALRWYPGLD